MKYSDMIGLLNFPEESITEYWKTFLNIRTTPVWDILCNQYADELYDLKALEFLVEYLPIKVMKILLPVFRIYDDTEIDEQDRYYISTSKISRSMTLAVNCPPDYVVLYKGDKRSCSIIMFIIECYMKDIEWGYGYPNIEDMIKQSTTSSFEGFLKTWVH